MIHLYVPDDVFNEFGNEQIHLNQNELIYAIIN